MTLLSPETKIKLTYILYTIAVLGATAIFFIGLLTLNRLDKANAQIKEQNSQIKAQNAQIKKQGQDVIKANDDQTLLLCTFILRSDLGVTDEAVIQLEEICEGEIERFQNRSSDLVPVSPLTPGSNRSIANNQPATPEHPRQAPQQPQEPVQPVNPPVAPPVPPGTVERLGNVISDTLGQIPKAVKHVFNLITPGVQR